MDVNIKSAPLGSLASGNTVSPSQPKTIPESIEQQGSQPLAEEEVSKKQQAKAEEIAEGKKALEKRLSEKQNVESAQKVAQHLQEFVSSLNKNLRFSVDEQSGREVISVVDKTSGELIRQIPSEEMLELASRISKAAGLLVTEKI